MRKMLPLTMTNLFGTAEYARACPQLVDSQASGCVIHGRSADSELTDATIRLARRPVGEDQRFFTGKGGPCRGYSQGQSVVRGSRSLPLSSRYSLAGPAGALR